MLIQKIVGSHFIVPHCVVGGPVVLRAVRLAPLDRGIDILVTDRKGRSAQEPDHILHHLYRLDTYDQALHFFERAHGFCEVEIPDTCVIPGERHQAGLNK